MADKDGGVMLLEAGDLLGFSRLPDGVDGLAYAHLRLHGFQVFVELWNC